MLDRVFEMALFGIDSMPADDGLQSKDLFVSKLQFFLLDGKQPVFFCEFSGNLVVRKVFFAEEGVERDDGFRYTSELGLIVDMFLA